MFGSNPLATNPYTPFLARLTAVASGSGGQANWHLYSWTEQAWDTNGFPVDANPARKGTTTSSYAFEVNNTLLTVPGSTPTGFANPGPYVWMRLKGVVAGIPVYEFDAGQSSSSGGLSVARATASLTGITLATGGLGTAVNWSTATLSNPIVTLLSISGTNLQLAKVATYQINAVANFATGATAGASAYFQIGVASLFSDQGVMPLSIAFLGNTAYINVNASGAIGTAPQTVTGTWFQNTGGNVTCGIALSVLAWY